VIDDYCAAFQLEWKNYVLCQVLNESFGMPALSTEIYEGKLARRYSISKLLQFALATTHATDEYPGKLLHLQSICEMHVIDVIVSSPALLQVRSDIQTSVTRTWSANFKGRVDNDEQTAETDCIDGAGWMGISRGHEG
jgi:hypothetical protein